MKKNKSKNTIIRSGERAAKINSLRELSRLPGVGKRTAEDLLSLGVTSVKSLASKDPSKLYEQICKKSGSTLDVCVLYTYKCAVHCASKAIFDKTKIHWWDFKDK